MGSRWAPRACAEQGLAVAPCARATRIGRAALALRAALIIAAGFILATAGRIGDAAAQCTSVGVFPTVVTCATNTDTTVSPPAIFGALGDITAQVNSGVTVSGQGLVLQATPFLPTSAGNISFTNNGIINSSLPTGNRALLLQVNTGNPASTITYQGTGSVTNTGLGEALFFDAGDGTGNATISSTSTISADGATGIVIVQSGSPFILTIQQGAVVRGLEGVSTAVNTIITNAGSVTATSPIGAGFDVDSGSLTNSGFITGPAGGVFIGNVGTTAAVTNQTGGIIETAGEAVGAVESQGTFTVINQAGAIIRGTSAGPVGSAGILVEGDTTITNDGTIFGTLRGILNQGTGTSLTVTNNASGIIQSSGGPSGAVGILTVSGPLTVTNFGQISGDLDGVNSNAGDTATVTNSGTISATTRSAIRLNVGSVINNTGGVISGPAGIVFRLAANNPVIASSSVFNDGTITGTAGTAIQFLAGSAGNTLTLGTNSVINGNVIGRGSDALVLAGSGSASLNLNQYQGFSSFAKIGTSSWSVSGSAIGDWTVSGGRLAVNGAITGNISVGTGANLGGSGTITGVVTNSGTLSPGNSIGTLSVVGSYTQAAGSTYQVEVNAAGQGDRISVSGTPGTATIQGGIVQIIAQPGFYRRSTDYVILSATGGRTGTFDSVTANFAFLTPSLRYDADNVILNLFRTNTAFADGGQTINQKAVGRVLDQVIANATGDFGDALNILSGLDTVQGPRALEMLGGQQYSGFQNLAVQSALIFMNTFQQQAGGSTGGNRIALAEVCEEPVRCELSPSRWAAWGGGVGSFGTIAGDGNGRTFTYNIGGFAAGLDRTFDSGSLIGVTLGYSNASLYPQTLPGQGTSSAVQAGLYGKLIEGATYLDALVGYAHADNRFTRQIIFPGLSRTAFGQTQANQAFGQLEAGHRIDLLKPHQAFVTPFARLQGSTTSQDAFTETGAGSLGLNIAQQTTNSLRSVIGAYLGAGFDLGWRDRLRLGLQLGWSHEYADTSRPVTASFTGAPATAFTTFGAQAPRDGAIVGLTASTAIADATSLFLRYDADIAGDTANHTVSGGVRMTW